jgi:hypothetical protein
MGDASWKRGPFRAALGLKIMRALAPEGSRQVTSRSMNQYSSPPVTSVI